MSEIIYAATPLRMRNLKNEICRFIELSGHFPVHPFNALPPDVYDYKRFKREDIYRACFGMIDTADQVWVFGLGSGCVKEWTYAQERRKRTVSLVRRFDPEWQEYLHNHSGNLEYVDLISRMMSSDLSNKAG